MITYGGPELLLLFVVFIVTPILYKKVLKKVVIKERIVYIAFLWIFTAAISYADVFFISMEARRLCREEAGLHVYKTVEVDGFLGATSIDYWSQYGFQYLEDETIMGGKKRYTLQNGKVVKEKVNLLLSQYEYINEHKTIKSPFTKGKKIIRNRKTGEVLGEIISFGVYPGWLDRIFLGFTGITWSPAGCDGDYMPGPQKSTLSYRMLVKSVLKPKKYSKGDK